MGASQQQKSAAAAAPQQKKTHTKLQLNPNAPLFSNAGGFDPNPQAYYPQGNNPNQNPNNFPTTNQAFKPNQFQYGGINSMGNQLGNNPQVGMPNQMGNNPTGNLGNLMGGNMPGNMSHNMPGNMGGNLGNNSIKPGPGNARENPMYFNTSQYDQNFQMQQNQQPGNFNKMQGPSQEMNYPQNFQVNQQVNMAGFAKPPGLGTPTLPNNMINQGFLPPPMFSNSNNGLNDSPNKKKSLQVDTKSGVGNFQNDTLPMSGGLSIKLDLHEAAMTPDKLQADDDNSALERGRVKTLNPHNLYTAVLSGKQRENSLSKSPSLSKIQKKYFSGFSTPRSDNTFTPPQSNTPRRRHTPTGSSADIGGDDNGDQPWTEDMIENFKLDNYIDNLVEFAKTYNGSRYFSGSYRGDFVLGFCRSSSPGRLKVKLTQLLTRFRMILMNLCSILMQIICSKRSLRAVHLNRDTISFRR